MSDLERNALIPPDPRVTHCDTPGRSCLECEWCGMCDVQDEAARDAHADMLGDFDREDF